MNKTVKIPGPDHPITIASNPKKVRVSLGATVIAETTHALTLREAAYPAVQYIPRADANMSLLTKTAHSTYCPYKGDAGYFTINAGGKTLDNAIWTYEQPYDSVKQIEGHLAFYPDKVVIEELS
jgi:uncharacterized protein (DUF427 family)